MPVSPRDAQRLGWVGDFGINVEHFRQFWRCVWLCCTDEEKSKYVLECRDIILKAREVAAHGNNREQLKPISDEARKVCRDLPEKIPTGGYKDINRMEYSHCWSAQRIEQEITDECRRLGVLDWLEVALSPEKTHVG